MTSIRIPSLAFFAKLFFSVFLLVAISETAYGADNDSSPVAGAPLAINGDAGQDEVRPVFLLPGESADFQIFADAQGRKHTKFSVEVNGGEVEDLGETGWTWVAPEKHGIYPIRVTVGDGDERTFTLVQAVVMVPFKKLKNGVLNGYRIGKYPAPRGNVYQNPRGFIEVTRENEDTLLTPHFRLKQFLCKQSSGWPKYVVLKEALLSKLEQILARANDDGYHWPGFHIMSGFRTPYYNRSLGNVRYSRHMYGDAADLLIDHDENGRMDDVNGDGRVNAKDSHVLRDIVESMEHESPEVFPVGGMGVYTQTKSHGPFIHVDARGTAARWGNKYRMARKRRAQKVG